jgi:hypothetical protein
MITNRPEGQRLPLPDFLWRPVMYERLDKLRDELRRAEKRKEDADKKLKIAQDRLREAESTQILADVEALHLTPEQVGQFLSMAANGQLPGMGMDPRKSDPVKEDVGAEDIAGTGAGLRENMPGDGDLEANDSNNDEYVSYSDGSRETEDEQTEDREDEYNA